MTEEQYRKGKLFLMAIFVGGVLFLGWRFAENGRYVQYDKQKDSLVFGNSAETTATQVIDTRSGVVRQAKHK